VALKPDRAPLQPRLPDRGLAWAAASHWRAVPGGRLRRVLLGRTHPAWHRQAAPRPPSGHLPSSRALAAVCLAGGCPPQCGRAEPPSRAGADARASLSCLVRRLPARRRGVAPAATPMLAIGSDGSSVRWSSAAHCLFLLGARLVAGALVLRCFLPPAERRRRRPAALPA
jgi:hypothetical protein